MQKIKSVFRAESFGANPLKVDFDARQQLLSAVSTAWVFFKYNVLIFERSREIDWGKKIAQPHIEQMSQQNKLESGPFSALFACASEATARD